ncbi:uncharacterized protein [Amphiura filiformis]|uniref:uncharacterized protein n=1 Tax=Amphiura filiformis TaxID=82378 RepID=UPI003B2184CC
MASSTHKQQWNLSIHPVCKYCQMKFHPGDIPRYFSHLRHHEMKIKPYWYTNPNMPPKAGCSRVYQNIKESQKTGDQDPLEETGFINLQQESMTDSDDHQERKLTEVYQDQCDFDTSKLQVTAYKLQNKTMPVCKYCNKQFLHLAVKRKHESMKHKAENHLKILVDSENHSKTGNEKLMSSNISGKYKCGYCSKTFTYLSSKKQHELHHTGEKSHKCSYCNKAFSLLCNKKSHELIHTGEKPYNCGYCPKTFAQMGQRKQHELIHTGEAPHICSYCHRGFTQAHTKNRHEMTHTGEKPYKCTYCNKTFATPGSKTQHELIHMEKPHKCSYCNKSFTYAHVLKTHKMTHTGEKPHKCSYCNKGFTQANNRNRHEMTHW